MQKAWRKFVIRSSFSIRPIFQGLQKIHTLYGPPILYIQRHAVFWNTVQVSFEICAIKIPNSWIQSKKTLAQSHSNTIKCTFCKRNYFQYWEQKKQKTWGSSPKSWQRNPAVRELFSPFPQPFSMNSFAAWMTVLTLACCQTSTQAHMDCWHRPPTHRIRPRAQLNHEKKPGGNSILRKSGYRKSTWRAATCALPPNQCQIPVHQWNAVPHSHYWGI